MAWIAALAFLLAAWHSALYLKTRNIERDDAAASAARLGILFCVLATVTGSIFAKVMWNSYWNWDPRETSIVLLLLVYGAYLGLRQAIEEPERRATLSAAYALVAFVTVPFLMFAVPRMYASLHPDTVLNARGKVEMSPDIKLVFFTSMIAFTALFAWMYALDVKATRLVRRLEERAAGGDHRMTPDAPTAAVSHGALFYVAAVNIIIWAGLFAYLVRLDRKVRSAMSRQTPEDPS